MKACLSVFIRALLLVIFFAGIGLMTNFAANNPIPWVYSTPREITIAGVTVQLIDELEAASLLDDPRTVFVDSRGRREYAKSHVRGAICLPSEEVEERFPSVEFLIPPESRVILYCHGPECDMAERVGLFLAQLGYKNMMIMSSGFSAWEKAKFPVQRRSKEDAEIEDPEDFWRQDEIADVEITSRRLCRCLGLVKIAEWSCLQTPRERSFHDA